MSLYLKLLPIDDDRGDIYSGQVISVYQGTSIYVRVVNQEPQLLEKPMNCYLGENGYGEVTDDAYGSPLKWLYAKQLVDADIKGTAAAFVAAMKPDARVVLFWE